MTGRAGAYAVLYGIRREDGRVKVLAAIIAFSLMLLVGFVIGWMYGFIADCIKKRLARRRNRDM